MMVRVVLILPFLFFNFNTVWTKSNPSVIIVGAGPAGIAAATKLLENSITNITILEAENRIGGRINSVKFGGGYVDLGAEFCHGEKGNTVYDLVKNFDILQHSDVHDFKVYNSKGSPIDSDLKYDLINSVDTYDEDLNTTKGLSLGEAFIEKYNSTILKKYSNDEKKLKIATDGIKLIHDLVLTHEGAFSWFQPAAGQHYEDCEGDQAMTWRIRGYQIILEVLMKSYPNPEQKLPIDDKILLNKKVTKIVWDGSNVQVHTSDNSTLTANHVIFTPSVGVLKEQKDTLFEPTLPRQKEDALKTIGFNGIMKIPLHFSREWWTEKDGVFYFLWNKDDLINIRNESIDGPKKDGVSWVTCIPAVARVPSNPNILIVWVSGELVPEVEKTPKDVLLKGVMYVIRRFLGKDYNITDPDEIIKSQWVTNPNFRGTYSYEKVGYFEEKVSYRAILAEPLSNNKGTPTLLFAGEATNSKHYSTVNGAIDSGRREAERIIQLYK